MEYNSLQTILDEKALPKEVYSEVIEFISSIQFIQNLISPNRKRAKDLEKDSLGRIIVDITNPHILENVDYFRQSAIHYDKFKKYTNLFPNPSPQSEYSKFWREEARRCREGYIRESDGEWIPGAFYFYLNYSPILKNKIIKGTKRSERGRGFPDFYDGSYLYYHYIDQAKNKGQHAGMLKRRGVGFSYTAGSDLTRLLILGESTENSDNVQAFAIASEKEYLIKDGILNKFDFNVNWCAANTPWPRLKSKDSLQNMIWEIGYTDSDGIVRGTRNSVIGVTTSGNPEHARGKRGPMYYDEWGIFPNLLKTWNVARDSVEEGDYAHSTMIGGGTGGTEGANFAGAEEMVYNPGGYNIYSIPNVFDKNVNGKTKLAFFYPAYLNRLGNYDTNGNSDVIGALVEIVKKRLEIKYNATDTNTLVQNKAEMCVTPQEAIMRREGSIFPISELKDYLADIMPNYSQFVSAHYVGHLKINHQGNVEWDKEEKHPILRSYPLKDELDRVGGIEIFELPKKQSDGSISAWRYIAGIDPIDSDEGTYTNSLGSCFVFDTWTDRIVAEYTGRPQLASDFYYNCILLLKFYNAIANYENNLKGLFQYFDTTRNLHYLCDTPQVLRDMDYAKGVAFGNRAHSYNEIVYTPAGKKYWKDIHIGDLLFDENGNSTKVIDIPFDDETDIYEVQLSDGRKVTASENHLFDVLKPVSKKRVTMTVKELLSVYKRKKDSKYYSYEYKIPTNKALNFEEKEIPLDAYTLGLILGDGTTKTSSSLNKVMFTSNLEDIEIYKKHIPYTFSKPYDNRHMRIEIKNIKNIFHDLNLSDKTSTNKFIPDIYKYNSKQIRLDVLKGLLDTDGYVKEGLPQFVSTSKQLAEDVMFISRSLGYNCSMVKQKAGYKKNNVYHKCNDAYKVNIWTNDKVFNLPRKQNKLLNTRRKLKARQLGIPITNISFLRKEKAKCVTVDSYNNCYLINECVVTHNSKGTSANKQINSWGRKLQADWLLSKAYTPFEESNEEKDENGNIIEKTILNLHKIRSIGYLKELISWNVDDNFDRVSAMGMLMILRADRLKYEHNKFAEKIKTIHDDPWFTRFTGTTKNRIINPAKSYLRYSGTNKN